MAEIIPIGSFRKKRRERQRPSMYRPARERKVLIFQRRYPKQKERLVMAQFIIKPGKKGEYPTFEEAVWLD